MFKPFKPPLVNKVQEQNSINATESNLENESPYRPYKKRRLIHAVEDGPSKELPTSSSAISAPRKPLLGIRNTNDFKLSEAIPSESFEGYYIVLWRKLTAKKHKTWDGDGVLSVSGGYAHLQDVSGRDMGRCMFTKPLLIGSIMSVGGKDVEIDSIISKEDFLARRPFLKCGLQSTSSLGSKSGSATKFSVTKFAPTKTGSSNPNGQKKHRDSLGMEINPKSFYAGMHKSDAIKSHFKNPLLSTTIMPSDKSGAPTPRHDPDAPNALVMNRPKDCPKGKQIVDVVLDPFLGQHLREHQREGVKFLYECVMGMQDSNGQGALLADEMGLGKTLQTIALLWTLLKQNPIYGAEGVIKKALIVCPVTLIANWKKEFNKWLGNERIGVFVADGQKNIRLTDFTHGKSYSVMIIGYEKLRSVQEELKKGSGIDIVIADEGHRLKTAQNKSAQAIRALNTERRVILSGTPLQNDLSEFFIMVDFINPGLLGTYNKFKKEFEIPILKSRQPGASERDIESGGEREEELSSLTKPFILRRTAEVLSKYLPPKTEYVLFCKPTPAQAQVYRHVLESPMLGNVLGSTDASLQLIAILKKVCNSPSLLVNREDQPPPTNLDIAQFLDVIPQGLIQKPPSMSSSKLRVLDRMLKHLSTNTKEKIVLVSNYTSTLDILGSHLASQSLPFLRLDGKTPAAKRQDLIDRFNRTPASTTFAFLLSAKSGGAGINLIGASRLVLFDIDWNPATDLQAMARIHRDGQKRPVKIYRLLIAGGIDEKIYQRQISKMGLADSIVDGKKNEASFSVDELRDLFRLDLTARCQTHDLLGCECKGIGVDPLPLTKLSDSPSGLIDYEVKNSDDDCEDLALSPSPTLLVSEAKAKANVSAGEKQSKKSKDEMQALMRYSHIDTSIFKGEIEDVFGCEKEEVKNARDKLHDEMLIEVLKDEMCKVDFVFAKG